MIKKIKHRTQHLPIAYTGFALGVGGFGNCLLNIFQFNNIHNAKWIICITISILFLFLSLILTKFLLHPKVLKYELNDQLTVSLLPTFSMSLMLVAGFIAIWDKSSPQSPNQIIAAILMCLAILIQLIIIIFFIKSFIVNHIKNKENHMYGTYFVPVVGLITSCTVQGCFVSLPNEFFQAIWFLGWSFFIFSLPFITYSMLFKKEKVSENQFPTVAVWFAPANLTCAGFVQVFLLADNKPSYYPSQFLIVFLLITVMMGFVTTLLLYLYMIRIFVIMFKNNNKKFSPILCSLSFPCAIGATSMIFTAKYFLQITRENLFFETTTWFFFVIACVFAIITFFILLFLLINLIKLTYKMLFTNYNDDKHHNVYK